jgi:hypothetical protein
MVVAQGGHRDAVAPKGVTRGMARVGRKACLTFVPQYVRYTSADSQSRRDDGEENWRQEGAQAYCVGEGESHQMAERWHELRKDRGPARGIPPWTLERYLKRVNPEKRVRSHETLPRQTEPSNKKMEIEYSRTKASLVRFRFVMKHLQAYAHKNYLSSQRETEPMNGTSEKYEDIMQYEIDALKEIRKNWFELAEEHTRHIDLVKGTALGLSLGIVGSLFVQFLYLVTEALLLGEYKPAFVGNLMVCGISLILIVFISVIFLRQLKRNQDKLELSRKSVEVIDYAIKRRQYSLEQGKKEGQQPSV